MPKLPVVKPQDVAKFLHSKHFIQTHSAGSHFRFHGPQGERVTVAFHNRALAKGTLMSILRQAELTKEDLVNFLKK